MDEAGETSKAERRINKKRQALFFTALVALAFTIGAIGAQFLAAPGISVPEAIAKQVSFPIYLPKQLPGKFEVVKDSFSFRDSVLIFAAIDSSGASISFTEQKRTPNFDFTEFHNNQLKDAKILSDVPYPSVFGKAKTGQTAILSVVTEETWLFVTTLAPLTAEDMQHIAAGFKLSR